MTTENTKEKVEETPRVFVENLPKPQKWLQEIAIIIAILAFFVSVYSAHLSRKEFIAAHRPYVYVSNRKDENGAMDAKSVLLHCLNAPAKIIYQNFCYAIIDANGNSEGKFIKTIPWTSLLITNTLYPSEKTSCQISSEYDFKKEILEKYPNVILKRKVRIHYKALSTDRTYYFEGDWDYDRKYNIWNQNNMFGN